MSTFPSRPANGVSRILGIDPELLPAFEAAKGGAQRVRQSIYWSQPSGQWAMTEREGEQVHGGAKRCSSGPCQSAGNSDNTSPDLMHHCLTDF